MGAPRPKTHLALRLRLSAGSDSTHSRARETAHAQRHIKRGHVLPPARAIEGCPRAHTARSVRVADSDRAALHAADSGESGSRCDRWQRHFIAPKTASPDAPGRAAREPRPLHHPGNSPRPGRTASAAPMPHLVTSSDPPRQGSPGYPVTTQVHGTRLSLPPDPLRRLPDHNKSQNSPENFPVGRPEWGVKACESSTVPGRSSSSAGPSRKKPGNPPPLPAILRYISCLITSILSTKTGEPCVPSSV